ncbi:MAG: PKD domain-containing protein, partial [Sphingobacteriales bacterium]
MQKLSGIYTRSKMGIDNKVWLTLLITTLISVGLFGFKMATTERCYDIKLNLKGVVAHPYANNYFVGESIIFRADMEKSQKVEWDFGDGTPVTVGNKIAHSFTQEGNFLVTATVNGKCMQSLNVHISQVAMSGGAAAEVASDPNAIVGKDFAGAGELAIYQTAANAQVFEWTIEGNAAFPPKSGNKAAFSFVEPGTYIVRLKLDNDDAKVYRKTVTVSVNPAAAQGAGLDELPPLPLPAPPSGGGAASDAGGGGAETPAAAEKKFELIPDPILQNQLQDVVEGKETLENIAKNMCDGMNTKVRG